MSTIRPITAKFARDLLGYKVRKIKHDPNRPNVVIGAIGVIASIGESPNYDWALNVDWGNDEHWLYDCLNVFYRDVEIIPMDERNGLTILDKK